MSESHYENGIRGLQKHFANGKSAHKSETFLSALHRSREYTTFSKDR